MIKRKKNIFTQQGFALVLVIVIMLLVSFLASQLIMQVRTELKIAFNTKARAASHFLSEAGVNLALFRLLDKPVYIPGLDITPADEDFHEGYTYKTSLPKGEISYYAVNESGKIDLNTSPRRLLELFMEYQHIDDEQINTITDSLLDWKDTDDLLHLNGAERDTYQQLDNPYEPRNGKIEEPAEFFLVNGADVLAGHFDPTTVFTVHNPGGKINFNSLTPAMLDFLVLGDQGRKNAYREAIQEYKGQLRAVARQIMGDERFEEMRPYLTFNADRGNNKRGYYFIVANGQAGYSLNEKPYVGDNATQNKRKGPGTRITALVVIKGNGFKYLAWKEDPT